MTTDSDETAEWACPACGAREIRAAGTVIARCVGEWVVTAGAGQPVADHWPTVMARVGAAAGPAQEAAGRMSGARRAGDLSRDVPGAPGGAQRAGEVPAAISLAVGPVSARSVEDLMAPADRIRFGVNPQNDGDAS